MPYVENVQLSVENLQLVAPDFFSPRHRWTGRAFQLPAVNYRLHTPPLFSADLCSTIPNRLQSITLEFPYFTAVNK